VKDLLPLFKWTGGKRKELPHIRRNLPSFVKDGETFNFVEPFAGAGAVFWALNNTAGTNIINDFDWDVANFYRHVAKQDADFLKHVKEASELFVPIEDVNRHDEQEAMFYKWRNADRNGGLANLSEAERAARFWIVNQLAFSGMRRFNSKGEFNVPFGHYKNLNSSALTSENHVNLLQHATVLDGDYKAVVEANDKPNTFIFIDPPYTRVMKTYSADSEFGEDKQEELAATLKALKHASFMVIIDKSELTERLYADNIIDVYDLSYGVNIRNRFDTSVQHIVATNYTVA
jgi:DNA adenine methylase